MNLKSVIHITGLLGCAWWAGHAHAADPLGTIEQQLRAQRPDVERWEIRPLGEQGDLRGQVTRIGKIGARMPVGFDDGRVHWFAVSGLREVIVAIHALDAGASLSPEVLRRQPRDIIASGCVPVEPGESGTRWRARRRVMAGEPLCTDSVEPAPEIQRNHAVVLSARSGAIQVSRVLTAAHDARTGERVWLRDRTTGDRVIAVATGPGAARLPGDGT